VNNRPTREPARVCVVGESLVDLVDDGSGRPAVAFPGGGPFNIAIGLARLGDRPTLVTHIGSDAYGDMLRGQLRTNGVGWEERGAGGHGTSVATAHLDQRGHATYEFDLVWDVAGLSVPNDASALHVGSLGTLVDPGAAEVIDLVERTSRDGTVLISFDPNARPALTPDRSIATDRFWRLAALSTVVKLSDEDLAFLTGSDFEPVADRILAEGCAIVIMTRGDDGIVAKTRAGAVSVSAIDVTVADTVGAGDSFTAAFLHALASIAALSPADAAAVAGRPDDVKELVSYASKAAAITVSRVGANPPTADEVEAFGD
jgi:fructokinase